MAKLVTVLLHKSEPSHPWGFAVGTTVSNPSVHIRSVSDEALAAAQLEVGDRVLEIDGIDTALMSQSDIDRTLNDPSSQLELLIMKKDKNKRNRVQVQFCGTEARKDSDFWRSPQFDAKTAKEDRKKCSEEGLWEWVKTRETEVTSTTGGSCDRLDEPETTLWSQFLTGDEPVRERPRSCEPPPSPSHTAHSYRHRYRQPDLRPPADYKPSTQVYSSTPYLNHSLGDTRTRSRSQFELDSRSFTTKHAPGLKDKIGLFERYREPLRNKYLERKSAKEIITEHLKRRPDYRLAKTESERKKQETVTEKTSIPYDSNQYSMSSYLKKPSDFMSTRSKSFEETVTQRESSPRRYDRSVSQTLLVPRSDGTVQRSFVYNTDNSATRPDQSDQWRNVGSRNTTTFTRESPPPDRSWRAPERLLKNTDQTTILRVNGKNLYSTTQKTNLAEEKCTSLNHNSKGKPVNLRETNSRRASEPSVNASKKFNEIHKTEKTIEDIQKTLPNVTKTQQSLKTERENRPDILKLPWPARPSHDGTTFSKKYREFTKRGWSTPLRNTLGTRSANNTMFARAQNAFAKKDNRSSSSIEANKKVVKEEKYNLPEISKTTLIEHTARVHSPCDDFISSGSPGNVIVDEYSKNEEEHNQNTGVTHEQRHNENTAEEYSQNTGPINASINNEKSVENVIESRTEVKEEKNTDNIKSESIRYNKSEILTRRINEENTKQPWEGKKWNKAIGQANGVHDEQNKIGESGSETESNSSKKEHRPLIKRSVGVQSWFHVDPPISANNHSKTDVDLPTSSSDHEPLRVQNNIETETEKRSLSAGFSSDNVNGNEDRNVVLLEPDITKNTTNSLNMIDGNAIMLEAGSILVGSGTQSMNQVKTENVSSDNTITDLSSATYRTSESCSNEALNCASGNGLDTSSNSLSDIYEPNLSKDLIEPRRESCSAPLQYFECVCVADRTSSEDNILISERQYVDNSAGNYNRKNSDNHVGTAENSFRNDTNENENEHVIHNESNIDNSLENLAMHSNGPTFKSKSDIEDQKDSNSTKHDSSAGKFEENINLIEKKEVVEELSKEKLKTEFDKVFVFGENKTTYKSAESDLTSETFSSQKELTEEGIQENGFFKVFETGRSSRTERSYGNECFENILKDSDTTETTYCSSESGRRSRTSGEHRYESFPSEWRTEHFFDESESHQDSKTSCSRTSERAFSEERFSCTREIFSEQKNEEIRMKETEKNGVKSEGYREETLKEEEYKRTFPKSDSDADDVVKRMYSNMSERILKSSLDVDQEMFLTEKKSERNYSLTEIKRVDSPKPAKKSETTFSESSQIRESISLQTLLNDRKSSNPTPAGFYDNVPINEPTTFDEIRSRVSTLLGGGSSQSEEGSQEKNAPTKKDQQDNQPPETTTRFTGLQIRQSSQISGGGSPVPTTPQGASNGASAPFPPPPPPMAPAGNIPSVRIPTEIAPKKFTEPPAAIQNAMMTKDKKPFTYTPGGLDLAEIRSPRMARRISRNAHTEDSCTAPQQKPSPLAQQPQQPLPPGVIAGMQPQIAVPVFPPAPSQFPAPPPPPPPPAPPGEGSAPVPIPPPLPSQGMVPPPPPPQGMVPPPPPPPMMQDISSNARPMSQPRPDFVSDIQKGVPLRQVSQAIPPRPDFVAEIPNHAPLRPVHFGSRYAPQEPSPLANQVQLKSVAPKRPSVTPQETPSTPTQQINRPIAQDNVVNQIEPTPPPVNNKIPQQEARYQPLYIPPPAEVSSPTPMTPKQTPPSPANLNKSPAPWLSAQKQAQKDVPPWASKENQIKEEPQREEKQTRQEKVSPTPSQGHSRVVPIQIESDSSNHQIHTQQKQAAAAVQQDSSQSQQGRTRIIPIQIEGASDRQPVQRQASLPSQSRGATFSPSRFNPSPSPFPNSPIPGDTGDGRPRQFQTQQSWIPGNNMPIQSRSFRVLQKITGSDEHPQGLIPPGHTFMMNRVFPRHEEIPSHQYLGGDMSPRSPQPMSSGQDNSGRPGESEY